MQALLLIAHGSRLQASNDEVKSLVESAKPNLSSKFDRIEAAFLELCEPAIGTAIDDLVSEGVNKITVLPYFLNQGRHVSEDVPHELTVKAAQYPDVTINQLPYFGRSKGVTDMIVKQASQSGSLNGN